jgi:hypothetical protein
MLGALRGSIVKKPLEDWRRQLDAERGRRNGQVGNDHPGDAFSP